MEVYVLEGNIEKIKSLSPMQEGMLFHSISNKSAYFEQVSFALKGDVDKDSLEKSIQMLVNRHEIFRTVFLYKTLASAKQVVLQKRSFKLLYEDISSQADAESYIRRKNEEERQNPFDLEKDLLIRFKLYKVNLNSYVLVWSYHHIVLDGWSTAKILSELMIIYNRLDRGIDFVNQLLGKPTPYSHYIDWLQKQNQNKAENFWTNYLDGYQNKIDLTLWKKALKSSEAYRVNDEYLVIEDSLTEEIREFSKKHQITLNQFFQTIWGVFLQKYFNTNDVVYGAVVSGRPVEIKNVEEIVGLFINTIPVRIKREPNMTFIDLLEKTRNESRIAENYSFLSLADIQNKSSEKDGLIQTLLIFQNYPKTEMEDDKLKFSLEGLDFYEEINYDFSIIVANNENLVIRFNYNANLFNEDMIKEIQQRFVQLIHFIVRNGDKKLEDVSILLEGEQEKMFHQGDMIELPAASLLDVLKTNSEIIPQHIAVQYAEEKLDYQTFYGNVKKWSSALSECGIKPGNRVAILVKPSIEWVTAVYSILGAGATFVPIDPTYPQERINYILEDAKVKCVITDQSETESLKNTQYIDIKTINAHQPSDSYELWQRNETDVSYMIYTSGSTGVPKGVQITDHSLKNLIYWHITTFNLTFEDRATKLAGLGFDASVWEVFPYITAGATLHIIDDNQRLELNRLCDYLNKHKITMMFLPTALYEAFVEYNVDSLKYLFVGGEKLNNYYPKNFVLVNNYGPTENTVVTTSMIVEKDELNIPIGQPIANQKVFIVNQDQLLQPIGAPGEIWASGTGISKGYWNNESLTAEKFLPSPWESSERVYKTGDYGRILPDGNIQYLGRIDQQVKIRGFRIEIGEIEKVLQTHFNIKDAVVTVKEVAGNKFLQAFIIPQNGEEIEKEALSKYLSAYLPEYMVPKHFYFIKSIPLTANGKIDYDKLQQIKGEEKKQISKITLTAFEESVAQIWSNVLGVKEIDVHDHFFDLGGHSIKAMQLVANIRKTLQLDCSVQDVYATPIFKDMCVLLMNASDSEQYDIPKTEDKAFYPVSSAQERMYVASDIDQSSTHYNMPFVYEMKGEFNLQALEESLQQLINRHEILRTSFGIQSNQIVQIVNKPFKASINTLCWKNQSPEQVEHLIRNWIQPFNFKSESLLRVEVAELSEERKLLLIDIHHIIFDGLSMDIFMKEWVDLYQGKKLLPKTLQYRDYAFWEKSEDGIKSLKKAEEIWLKEMEGVTESQGIPTDWTRPAVPNFAGDRIQFSIPEAVYTGLKRVSKQNNVSLFTTLLSLYSIIISKYSNQNDIVVGTPFSGREHKDVEDMIGMFVNVLPIRTQLTESIKFEKLLQQVQEKVVLLQECQIYPFEQLVQNLNVERGINKNPIFTTVFSYRNSDQKDSTEVNFGDSRIKPIYYENPVSKFDLSLNVLEINSALFLEMEYAIALYKKETVQKIFDVFIELSTQVIQNMQLKINELSVLLPQDKTVNESINESLERSIDDQTTFLDLFENMCEQLPEQPALIHKNRKLTYEELNSEANKWAKHLVKIGIKKGDHIAIYTTATFEYVIAQLAILKIGAVFIPLDPDVPKIRMEFILKDANVSCVMTNKAVHDLDYSGVIIDMNNVNLEESPTLSFEKVSPESVAYMIYTSGSTGQPKGVLIKHSSLVELIDWHKVTFETNKDDRATKLSGLAFDASILEIYPLLAVGASLYFIDKDLLLETENFNNYLEENKITVMFLPTPLYQEFSKVNNKSLRYLLVGGAKLNQYTPRNYKLVNNYGPTESTVVATSYLVDEYERDIPIGTPIGRTKLFILNHHNQPQSIGYPGEICLSGPALSIGYYGRDELTKEKFIPSPFNKDEILYRTGDYGKLDANGDVYYLGRIDDQVKINGNRIEIGEIEVCLKRLSGIQDAIVTHIKDENNRSQLHCYVIAININLEEIKAHLYNHLPVYMVPSKFVFCDKFPLTLNGKVDIAKLKELSLELNSTKSELIVSDDPVKDKIAEVWKEVLNVEILSYEENLFIYGGNSIDASMILSKVNTLFETQVKLKEFLINPTISSLSSYVKNSEKIVAHKGIEIDLTMNPFPLSPHQEYMYKFSKGNTNLNIPVAFELKGNIDVEQLNKAFKLLMQKHEILRTSFHEEEEKFYQFVHSDIDFIVEQVELEGNTIEQFVQSFDFTKPPLMRAKLVKTGSNKTYLFFDIHHLISDGYSMNVLFEDLNLAYKGELSTVSSTSYKEYVLTQRWNLENKVLDHEQKFWLEKYKEPFTPLDFPLDFERPEKLVVDGKLIFSSIDGELYNQLMQFIKTNGYSTFTVLLSFYYVCLYRSVNWEDPIVGTYTAGRADEKFKNTIGLFTNTIPLKTHIKGQSNFVDLLEVVHQEVLDCFNHQEYPFNSFISELPYSLPENRTALFDTMFVLQNMGFPAVMLGDVIAEPIKMDITVSDSEDIYLAAVEAENYIHLEWGYNGVLFKEKTVLEISQCFNEVIELILANLEMPLKELKQDHVIDIYS